jgi:hypothetical protein
MHDVQQHCKQQVFVYNSSFFPQLNQITITMNSFLYAKMTIQKQTCHQEKEHYANQLH